MPAQNVVAYNTIVFSACVHERDSRIDWKDREKKRTRIACEIKMWKLTVQKTKEKDSGKAVDNWVKVTYIQRKYFEWIWFLENYANEMVSTFSMSVFLVLVFLYYITSHHNSFWNTWNRIGFCTIAPQQHFEGLFYLTLWLRSRFSGQPLILNDTFLVTANFVIKSRIWAWFLIGNCHSWPRNLDRKKLLGQSGGYCLENGGKNFSVFFFIRK